MSCVIVSVEANQVTLQNTEKECLSDWQNSVDLTRGEWSMEEEANLDVLLGVTNLFSQHGWEEHEMIIVNPDQITILNILGHGLCKQTVDLLVCSPCGLVECDLSWVVVEKWPKDLV
jgi:hypothetical protein